MPDLPPLSAEERLRYARHLSVPGIGEDGQRRLKGSSVLMIGTGGLGSPAALYLAAAGVGRIGLIDPDTVDRSNLQRQILHGESWVGKPKLESAAARLKEINPHVELELHPVRFAPDNALDLVARYDVVLDGCDNFPTRFLSNDACFLLKKPCVYGSIFRFEGQLSVFAPHLGGPCYRCLFPEPPATGTVPNCGEAGVLGALCGVIGSLQALEAVKLVTGIGEPLRGRLLTYDALGQNFSTLKIPRDPACRLCGAAPAITTLDPARYDFSCAPAPLLMTPDSVPLELTVEESHRLLTTAASDTHLIDVREPFEFEICAIAGAEPIPMRQIPERLGDLPREKHLLIHCHHGGRSLRVTEYLRAQGFPRVSNVAGGIEAWAEQIDPTLRRY